jgi:hypothetical protein
MLLRPYVLNVQEELETKGSKVATVKLKIQQQLR